MEMSSNDHYSFFFAHTLKIMDILQIKVRLKHSPAGFDPVSDVKTLIGGLWSPFVEIELNSDISARQVVFENATASSLYSTLFSDHAHSICFVGADWLEVNTIGSSSLLTPYGYPIALDSGSVDGLDKSYKSLYHGSVFGVRHGHIPKKFTMRVSILSTQPVFWNPGVGDGPAINPNVDISIVLNFRILA